MPSISPDNGGRDWQGKDVGVPERFSKVLPSPVAPHPVDELLTAERAHTFRQVLARRTNRLAVVLEDCYDPHNATAVMRTCDIFGVMRVHCTTDRTKLKINSRVSQGAHKYLDLRVHGHIDEAYEQLRADGYRIMVSDLKADAVIGPQALRGGLDDQPLAVVFGSEGFGISEAARAGADGCFLLPMAGFSQSLNLSVSVATTVYALRGDQLAADAPGDLTTDEQTYWYDHWVRRQRGPAADRVCAQDSNYHEPPDPRAHVIADKDGESLETFEGS